MKKALLFVCVIVLISVVSGCIPKQRISETRTLMGTEVIITLIEPNKEKGLRAIDDAFSEIERIENVFSIYSNVTEVFELNDKKFIKNASDELIYVLEKSMYYSEMSNGAFDITVQPLLDLYKTSFETNNKPPSEEKIKKILKYVDFNDIVVDNDDKILTLRTNKTKITLGGIAKGYSIDKAIEVLENNEIKNAIVNAGGDLKAIGRKISQPWSIALANPENKNEYITIIKIENKAVATSGNYERYFDEKKKVHHIINPKTGKSASDLISVTIIADKAIDADALATSVFVLGREKGLELVESLANVEALLITNDKQIIKSKGFIY